MWKQRHWGVKPVSWSCAVCYWLSIDHIKAQEDMSGSIHDSLTTHHRTQRYNQALAHRHSGQQVVTLVNYSLTSFTESHQYYILSYDLCWCQLEITCPQWICSGPHVSLHAEQLQNWNTRLFHSSSNVSLHSIWENISDFREALKKRTLLEPLMQRVKFWLSGPGLLA